MQQIELAWDTFICALCLLRLPADSASRAVSAGETLEVLRWTALMGCVLGVCVWEGCLVENEAQPFCVSVVELGNCLQGGCCAVCLRNSSGSNYWEKQCIIIIQY